jgi:hypothetical protein
MHFHTDESEEIALEVLRAVVSRLTEVEIAARAPLSDDLDTRIEQLQDRITGLRYVLETTNEQLQQCRESLWRTTDEYR